MLVNYILTFVFGIAYINTNSSWFLGLFAFTLTLLLLNLFRGRND